jgi:multidrug efflux pump subunit AcrB
MPKKSPEPNRSVYLNKLKFPPALAKTRIAAYLTNIRLVSLLLMAIVPIGIFSYLNLPRRLNPEVDIPIVSVITSFPGASPEEMESLITIPIEDALGALENVDTITSSSRESVSTIIIQFESTVPTKSAQDDVQTLVDGVGNLPQEAQTPRVNALDFENIPILTFALTSSADIVSLNRFAKQLQKSVEGLREVDRVEVTGLAEEEIRVLMEVETLNTIGLSPSSLAGTIRGGLSQIPSGLLETETLLVPVSVDKSIYTVDDIRRIPLQVQNEVVELGSLATISQTPRSNQARTFIIDTERGTRQAVSFAVYKTKLATITDAASQVHGLLETELENNAGAFRLDIIEDNAALIADQFNELSISFGQTLFLVFVTLFVFLGIRQSLIVALSIPITFLISFTVMGMTGLSLNFLSLFSLLLALGLLVDDAIVIVSAYTSYKRIDKFTPAQTGLLVWRDFIVPIWSTTITTMWAFLPLLLATGIIGEFIKTIPIVVSSTLLASTAVAVLITLPVTMQIFDLKVPSRVRKSVLTAAVLLVLALYLVLVPREPIWIYVIGFGLYLSSLILALQLVKRYMAWPRTSSNNSKPELAGWRKRVKHGLVDAEVLADRYRDLINLILRSKARRWRIIILVIIFSLFSYLLLPLGLVVNEFFPKIEGDNLFITLRLPAGTKAAITEAEGLAVAQEVVEYDDVARVVVETGVGFGGFGVIGNAGEHRARLTLNLVSKSEREYNSIELAKELRRRFAGYAQGELSVVEESAGPPAGADVQMTVLGDDLSETDRIANQLQSFLASLAGVTNVEKSIQPAGGRLKFIPDQARVTQHGLSVDQIGLGLRTFTSGLELGRLTLEDEERSIYLRLAVDQASPEELGRIKVLNPRGARISLFELGRFEPTSNPAVITREDGKRSITVSASVIGDYSVAQANARLEEYADSLRLPPGYEFKTGGVNQENQRSVQSIIYAMVVSAVLILATMVVQLGSFRKAIIVLLVIPLAISGVFVVFALTGTPLSFPALIGVLALFGIVVNNSIVIIEKINQNLKVGIEFTESIADAAASRVQPILFSSLTTIFGLLPITITDPLWRGLGGAIIAGLSFSGVIMLFFIPVVYYSWFKDE